jgi:RNA polymerase sigma-70 factor, ECF subfamily
LSFEGPHDPNGFHAARLRTAPDQLSHLDYEDLRTALAKLLPTQREALILVTAEGLSYEDAAAVCGTAVGTIKSAPGSGSPNYFSLIRPTPSGLTA